MAIKERKQITGTEAQIKSFAGHNGVLAFAHDTKHLHVLSGTAGQTTELANKADIPAPVDISGKADKTYVDTELAKKQAKGNYATSEQLTQGLAGKQPTGDYATNAQLTQGLAGKQPTGDYATNAQLTQGLAGKANSSHTHTIDNVTGLKEAIDSKLGKTEKASKASVADTANSVAWSNVTGRPSIPSSPEDYVTSYSTTSTSWYRVWKSGLVEQGGRVSVSSSNSPTVTFPKPFSNSEYVIRAAFQYNGDYKDTESSIAAVLYKTTTKCDVSKNAIFPESAASSKGYITWYAFSL